MYIKENCNNCIHRDNVIKPGQARFSGRCVSICKLKVSEGVSSEYVCDLFEQKKPNNFRRVVPKGTRNIKKED